MFRNVVTKIEVQNEHVLHVVRDVLSRVRRLRSRSDGVGHTVVSNRRTKVLHTDSDYGTTGTDVSTDTIPDKKKNETSNTTSDRGTDEVSDR